jgi:protein TonB
VPNDTPDIEPFDWEPLPFDQPLPYTPPGPENYDGFVASSAKPRLVAQARAAYPEIARRSGIEGTVVVQALVNVEGRVKKAVIVQGAHPILDKEALLAARKCRFTPARQREMKVEVWVAIPYRFRLR